MYTHTHIHIIMYRCYTCSHIHIVFTQVPAELYDTVLRNLFLVDHEAVDAILRRNVEQPE